MQRSRSFRFLQLLPKPLALLATSPPLSICEAASESFWSSLTRRRPWASPARMLSFVAADLIGLYSETALFGEFMIYTRSVEGLCC